MHGITYIALYVSLHTSFSIRILCQNPRVVCQLGCLMAVALMSRDSFVSWVWKGKETICLDPSLTEAITGPLHLLLYQPSEVASFSRLVMPR